MADHLRLRETDPTTATRPEAAAICVCLLGRWRVGTLQLRRWKREVVIPLQRETHAHSPRARGSFRFLNLERARSAAPACPVRSTVERTRSSSGGVSMCEKTFIARDHGVPGAPQFTPLKFQAINPVAL